MRALRRAPARQLMRVFYGHVEARAWAMRVIREEISAGVWPSLPVASQP